MSEFANIDNSELFCIVDESSECINKEQEQYGLNNTARQEEADL